MSIKKFPHHYSMTSPASVYDEEAMTALELAGRTAAKLNEVIDQSNATEETVKDWDNRLPDEITKAAEKQVDKYVENGTFDEAIDRYAGNLESRLDNAIGSMVEGSTTMDAEVIDSRVAYDGRTYTTAGRAIREQAKDLNIATNDRLSATAMKCGYKCNYNRLAMWEQGWIGEDGNVGNTGTDNDNYIRTRDFIPYTVNRIETIGGAAGGIRLRVYIYTKAGAFVRREPHNVSTYIFDHDAYKYKVAATGSVGLASDGRPNLNGYDTLKMGIDPTDAEGILMLGEPDENGGVVSMDASRYGYKVDYNARHLWEQGYIYAADGENGVDPTGWDFWLYNRLVGYVPENVECVGVAAGFKGRLFKWSKATTNFEGVETFTLSSNRLDHNTYKYRVDFVSNPASPDKFNYTNDVWKNVYLLGAGEMKSPYLKDVYYPAAPADYYRATGSLSTGLNASAPASTVYSLFDSLWYANITGHLTRKAIGTSAGGQTLYAYTVKTRCNDEPVVVNRPKVVIVAGQHGFEKGNVFGLYQFMYDLMNNWENSTVLAYIRDHIELVVVPVANPDGFDGNSYKNKNGVNLNRNYSYNWTKIADTSSDQYGGAAAFDQPETKAIRDLILGEDNVVAVIDSHSKGPGSVGSNADINWIACCNRTEAGYMRLANVVKTHLSTLNNRFTKQYEGKILLGSPIGYFTGFDGTGNGVASLDNWATYECDTIGVTVEGFNAFPANTTLHSIDVQKANAEILGNFIMAFVREYGRG